MAMDVVDELMMLAAQLMERDREKVHAAVRHINDLRSRVGWPVKLYPELMEHESNEGQSMTALPTHFETPVPTQKRMWTTAGGPLQYAVFQSSDSKISGIFVTENGAHEFCSHLERIYGASFGDNFGVVNLATGEISLRPKNWS